MPTYEYECQQCGHRFEEFQSITAAPRQTCPETSCKGSVKRLIGMGGGLIFKGTGFLHNRLSQRWIPKGG